jgi:hypothetical protein
MEECFASPVYLLIHDHVTLPNQRWSTLLARPMMAEVEAS